jgi:Spy/CpxP family protein refolding chaperone
MKKILMVTLLSIAVCSALQAQNANSKLTEEQRGELKLKMDAYKDRLNLNEDQSAKVEAINIRFYESLLEIKTEGGSKLSRYKKLKQVSRNKDKEMKEVLTAEQYKIYKEQQKEFKEEIKSRRNN